MCPAESVDSTPEKRVVMRGDCDHTAGEDVMTVRSFRSDGGDNADNLGMTGLWMMHCYWHWGVCDRATDRRGYLNCRCCPSSADQSLRILGQHYAHFAPFLQWFIRSSGVRQAPDQENICCIVNALSVHKYPSHNKKRRHIGSVSS
jgi:hypothetical protein